MAAVQVDAVETERAEGKFLDHSEPIEGPWPIPAAASEAAVAVPPSKPLAGVGRYIGCFWAWLFAPGPPAQLVLRVPDGWWPPVI